MYIFDFDKSESFQWSGCTDQYSLYLLPSKILVWCSVERYKMLVTCIHNIHSLNNSISRSSIVNFPASAGEPPSASVLKRACEHTNCRWATKLSKWDVVQNLKLEASRSNWQAFRNWPNSTSSKLRIFEFKIPILAHWAQARNAWTSSPRGMRGWEYDTLRETQHCDYTRDASSFSGTPCSPCIVPFSFFVHW